MGVPASSPLSSRAGVTLTELMISVAVVTIGVLGLLASFGGIQRALLVGKEKTLASNLAQEKLQIVEQQTYFRVVPTMSPAYLADGTPYDTANFPPETILQGGVAYQRYTYVQVVSENNGVIVPQPPTTPDTGMRQISVTVAWQDRGRPRELSLKSVMSNPNTVEASSVVLGTVRDAATNAPITGALVDVAENMGWSNTTDSGGSYRIQLSPGSYNVVAAAAGYFNGYAYQTIGANNTATVNFLLTAMSSGAVSGTAWVNPAIVISEVVVSTPQANGYNAEYLELFNPTTSVVTVGGAVNFNFATDHNNTQCLSVPLNYVRTSIPAGGYFVVANTTTFTINGSVIAADAYYTDLANASCSPGAFAWNPPNVRRIMHPGQSGTWWLTDSSGNTIDAAGWSNNGRTYVPSHCLGTCLNLNGGLHPGWELVRASSPAFFSAGYGRAYDSRNNSIDFTTSDALAFSPYDSLNPPQTVVAGRPAVGAVVTASDGLSTSTAAYASSVLGGWPAASFSLTSVATGTWTVLITSGAYQLENDTVTIPAAGSSCLFPSSTTILSGTATSGFVTGAVVDAFGNAISAPSAIKVSAAGQTATADPATGRYLLRSPSGPASVVANPSFANANYVSISSAVTVSLGQVTSGVNFTLSQGGRISGWVTRDGVNGLQGVTVVATDSNGNAQDQEISDVGGNFKTINLATGTYVVKIPLDTTETSSPTSASAAVALGQTVFAGTFTITGALGTIQGGVTRNGSPISSGVLIVVATGTLPSGPPDLSSATLTSGAYYLASSGENGTYSVDVRQSTSPAYNVYGYYTTVDASGRVTIAQKSLSNVPVTAGQTVTGKNLAW